MKTITEEQGVNSINPGDVISIASVNSINPPCVFIAQEIVEHNGYTAISLIPVKEIPNAPSN